MNFIGLAIALFGAVAALIQGKTTTRDRRWLACFLAGSASLGLFQEALNRARPYFLSSPLTRENHWLTTSSWVGMIGAVVLFIPLAVALIEASRDNWRRWLYAILWISIIVWACWCLGGSDVVFGRSFLPLIPLAVAGFVFGSADLASSVWTRDKRLLIFGAVTLISQALDILGYIVIRDPNGKYTRVIWAIRNAVWCLVYVTYTGVLLWPLSQSRKSA